jgi:predicted acylesterase/phospholipase RssA
MKRIAIACQGGGSHTAFTAGALKRILKEHKNQYEIAALSGTSGGAICALLAWYGIIKGDGENRETAIKMLDSFWKDMSASTFGDMLMNEWVVQSASLQDRITMPQASPYSYPPFGQEYMRMLLEKQVEFDKIKTITDPKVDLLIGTVDVLTGEFCVFKNSKVSTDVILASAAIPTFFRAVSIDKYLFSWNKIPGNDRENGKLIDILRNEFNIEWSEPGTPKIEKYDDNTIKVYDGTKYISLELNDNKTTVYLKINKNEVYNLIVKAEIDDLNIYYRGNYWDGLFSQNPPIRDLINENIDELWVIQIYSRSIDKLPESVSDITDRRNELAGNLSLYQELFFIEKVNQWIKKGYFREPGSKESGYRNIDVKFIRNLLVLGHETKLDRNPEFIEKMMKHGEKQADEFLKELPVHTELLHNIVY